MQPLVEHWLGLGGHETRALELEGDGPPVLLIHGFADSADTWRPVLDLLARRERRALAVDLPGFGAATPLDARALVLDQLDAFVHHAIGYLAADGGPVVVAGNSLGGCLSLRAAAHPDTPVCGIVPVAPAGFDHPFWFRAIEAQPLLRALLSAPVPVPEIVVRTAVGEVYRQLAFARPRAMDGRVVSAFTYHHRSRRRVSGMLGTGRRLMPELHDPFLLEQIRVPVLLIWGDRDRMVSHKGSRHLLAALPDTRYELYEGIGHCPQVEVPQRVADDLEAFVASLGGVTRGRRARTA